MLPSSCSAAVKESSERERMGRGKGRDIQKTRRCIYCGDASLCCVDVLFRGVYIPSVWCVKLPRRLCNLEYLWLALIDAN